MDQRAKLYYLRDSPLLKTQKPYMIGPGFMKTIPVCNYSLEAGPEQVIKDVRGFVEEFTLPKHGFAFRPWSPSKIDWEEEDQILDTYIPEVKELLRHVLDIGDSFKRCEVFDWRVSLMMIPTPGKVLTRKLRNTDSKNQITNIEKGRMTKIRPADVVHIGVCRQYFTSSTLT